MQGIDSTVSKVDIVPVIHVKSRSGTDPNKMTSSTHFVTLVGLVNLTGLITFRLLVHFNNVDDSMTHNV